MDFAKQRHNMIEGQIRTNRVTDERILVAMQSVARELFVPKNRRALAYADEAVEIASGRFLMEPMLAARLVQAAQVQPTDAVLLIGCGTGYLAAILSKLASAVVAVESDRGLAAEAGKTLAEIGVDTVALIEGPLADGYSHQAPYDAIVVDGAVDSVPPALIAQLAEGGRLVAVVAAAGAGPVRMGKGVRLTRVGDVIARAEIFEGGTPLLPGFARPPVFAF
ncbi:MAG: protein-L-isoaspartate O-methyltransferase [Alphaproteobacteria bacterium]|nr:protein-L-isoaspartate O-methyltransferase [Alphaproteobacteria bacterium]